MHQSGHTEDYHLRPHFTLLLFVTICVGYLRLLNLVRLLSGKKIRCQQISWKRSYLCCLKGNEPTFFSWWVFSFSQANTNKLLQLKIETCRLQPHEATWQTRNGLVRTKVRYNFVTFMFKIISWKWARNIWNMCNDASHSWKLVLHPYKQGLNWNYFRIYKVMISILWKWCSILLPK